MYYRLDRKTNSAFTFSNEVQAWRHLTSFKNEFSKSENFELEVVNDWY